MHRGAIKRLPTPVLQNVLKFISPPTCCLVDINTSFPSEVKNGRVYGGPILVQVENLDLKTTKSEGIITKLRLTYTDRGGKEQGNEITLSSTPSKTGDFYSSFAAQKAVLLQRYVQRTQEFLIAYHEKQVEEKKNTAKSLREFSVLFTKDAAALKDKELAKTAEECATFVKDHCAEEPRRRLVMM
eukprot:TRINITY_DN10842_c0_g1_i2.p1 TRINITY_DN10842_c0_g1~~TRINITY_DN10842_c0_g1_i2.p1  ORF type:complete len:185 (+),score=33.16 TRINITY_DN10842_c0_g1_i2:226-780(+)